MDLQTAKTYAVQRSFGSRCTSVIYKTDTGYNYTGTNHLGASNVIMICRYEKGKIKITDADGKRIETIERPGKDKKEPKAKKLKKEEPKETDSI